MTRSFYKSVTIRAVIAILLSLSFLFACLFEQRRARASEQQMRLREIYGDILNASEYRPLKTDILNEYQDIQAVYSAYDSTGKLIGYIVDVATNTSYGYIHTQMSISENGEKLLDLRVIVDQEDAVTLTDEEMTVLSDQLRNARIPVTVFRQSATDVPYQVEYDPLLGLHDGVYYSESQEPSSDGYTDYCEIEVSGGRIVRVLWDARNDSTHTLRSEASISGDYKVKGNMWADQAYRLQNYLVVVQDPMKLAMKSDGTTEIIDGVTIDISTFVTLVKECIEYSRSSFTKEMYLAPDPDEENPGDVTPTVTPEGQEPVEVTPTATPFPTTAPSEIGVIGGEDGVVQGDSGNILSESVDGIPMSEIRTHIDGLMSNQEKCMAVLSTINIAYKFMREYLNWVG